MTEWEASHYALSPMSTQDELLAEIETFLSTRKMAETTFGRVVVNDGKFVARLRSGANMTLATVERVREHIRQEEARRTADAQPQAAA